MEISYHITAQEFATAIGRMQATAYKQSPLYWKLELFQLLVFVVLGASFGFFSIVGYDAIREYADYYDNSLVYWAFYGLIATVVLYYFSSIIYNMIYTRFYNNHLFVSEKSAYIGEAKLVLQPNGIFCQNQGSEALYYYAGIYGVEKIKDFLIIRIDRGVYLPIPEHGFKSEQQRQQFESELNMKLHRQTISV